MNPSFPIPAGESSTPQVPMRQVKKRHSPEAWEQHKALVERLYLDEDKTVEETMRYLQVEKNFIVGERKFKMQLKEWGFDKNIKSSVMQLMLAKATKRKFEEDKETKFRYKGRDILPQRFSQYAKRSHVKNGKRVSPSASTPSFVSYLTVTTSTSSLSVALRRVASMNVSIASIASTISAFQQGRHALRRSFSNLSGRTFSLFKRRGSYNNFDDRPMSLASLDDLPFPTSSHKDMENWGEHELLEIEDDLMKEKLSRGCQSCQKQVVSAVKEHFATFRDHIINRDYEKAEEAADNLSGPLSLMCCLCRPVYSRYIVSVLYMVARYYRREERYHHSISIYERVLQTCIDEDLFDCSHVLFNCAYEIVDIYAYQGLLHEVEQRLLQDQAENKNEGKLAMFCNRLLLAAVFTNQQRPQEALREYGNLATLCIDCYGLHSAFMHRIVFSCAILCTELRDYSTSVDLYRRLLVENNPTDYVLKNRIVRALLGLSNTYCSAGSYQNCKKFANKAMEILLAYESTLVPRGLFHRLIQCYLNLAVSFDNEGNDSQAESYFSRVIVGCGHLNQRSGHSDAASVMLALQRHYYDRPRIINAVDPTIDNYLVNLADSASGRPAALQRLLVAIIWEAESLSKAHQPQRAEYLFNQAKALLDPANLHLQCFFATQIAQHHRRNKEWKNVLRCLDKAASLSEQMYGPNHACTLSFRQQIAAFAEEMEKEGLSINAMAQSFSLITLSSLNSKNTGSNESDEMDFLEDGMFWGQPPSSLLQFA